MRVLDTYIVLIARLFGPDIDKNPARASLNRKSYISPRGWVGVLLYISPLILLSKITPEDTRNDYTSYLLILALLLIWFIGLPIYIYRRRLVLSKMVSSSKKFSKKSQLISIVVLVSLFILADKLHY